LAINNSSLFFQQRSVPNLVFSLVNQLFSFANNAASTGTGSFSQHIGFYTQNVSTLSLLHSTSMGFTVAWSGNNNSATIDGIRYVTTAWSSTISKGDYWVAVLQMSTTSSQNGTIRPFYYGSLNLSSAWSGIFGAASNATNQPQLGVGRYTAATAALPSSVAFSDIQGTAMYDKLPAFGLGATV
jgi:hypothetical protein